MSKIKNPPSKRTQKLNAKRIEAQTLHGYSDALWAACKQCETPYRRRLSPKRVVSDGKFGLVRAVGVSATWDVEENESGLADAIIPAGIYPVKDATQANGRPLR